MTTPSNRRVKVVHIAPRTWLGRLFTTVGTIALLLLAIFFFTIFLTVFTGLAAVIIARILWSRRQMRQKAAEHVIDVEYSVEKTEAQQRGETKPVDDKGLDDRRNQARKP